MRFTPAQRKAIYGIVAAANTVAVAFGVLTGEQAAAVATSATSILGLLLAFGNVDNGPTGGAA